MPRDSDLIYVHRILDSIGRVTGVQLVGPRLEGNMRFCADIPMQAVIYLGLDLPCMKMLSWATLQQYMAEYTEGQDGPSNHH
jgi:hypothetical protein